MPAHIKHVTGICEHILPLPSLSFSLLLTLCDLGPYKHQRVWHYEHVSYYVISAPKSNVGGYLRCSRSPCSRSPCSRSPCLQNWAQRAPVDPKMLQNLMNFGGSTIPGAAKTIPGAFHTLLVFHCKSIKSGARTTGAQGRSLQVGGSGRPVGHMLNARRG